MYPNYNICFRADKFINTFLILKFFVSNTIILKIKILSCLYTPIGTILLVFKKKIIYFDYFIKIRTLSYLNYSYRLLLQHVYFLINMSCTCNYLMNISVIFFQALTQLTYIPKICNFYIIYIVEKKKKVRKIPRQTCSEILNQCQFHTIMSQKKKKEGKKNDEVFTFSSSSSFSFFYLKYLCILLNSTPRFSNTSL